MSVGKNTHNKLTTTNGENSIKIFINKLLVLEIKPIKHL